MIPRLSPDIRQYIARFSITSIAVWADGRIKVTRDPHGATSAYWCRACDAKAIVRLARRNRATFRADGDYSAAVLDAARSLRLGVTPHDRMVARVTNAVASIEASFTTARQDGRLSWFNRAYRERRIEAGARGERYMTYPQAERKLRGASAGVGAGDSQADLVRRTFDEP